MWRGAAVCHTGLAAGFAHYHAHAADKEHLLKFFEDVLEMLLDRDVPVDMRLPDDHTSGASTASSSRTALMYAALAGSPRIVKALLAAGAKVNLKDPRGVTPLVYACLRADASTAAGTAADLESRLEVVRLLLDAGAHVDVRDIAGQTALMNACSKDSAPLVRMLLEAGATVTLRHGKGSTCVGVLAAGLRAPRGVGTDADDTTTRELIAACMDAAGSDAARALLREEVKASEWFHLMTLLMPIHNKFVETPKARMGDREAALVEKILALCGMDDDYLRRPPPDVSAGERWGNFYEQLQRKLTALIPQAFLTVWTDHPSVDDFSLLTAFSDAAIAEAERRAERLSRERYNGIRTSAYHPETLREQSLVPWQARGRVPACMKDYQNLIVLPPRRCISHAVPTAQALKAIAKLGPLIEMGAGGGYWAAMLRERKVDIVAYDIDPPDPATLANGFCYRQFCDVHSGDSSIFAADQSLAQRTLLLIWPGARCRPPTLCDDETRRGVCCHPSPRVLVGVPCGT